jgi:hypothetical protein
MISNAEQDIGMLINNTKIWSITLNKEIVMISQISYKTIMMMKITTMMILKSIKDLFLPPNPKFMNIQ